MTEKDLLKYAQIKNKISTYKKMISECENVCISPMNPSSAETPAINRKCAEMAQELTALESEFVTAVDVVREVREQLYYPELRQAFDLIYIVGERNLTKVAKIIPCSRGTVYNYKQRILNIISKM